ncbi:MAG: ABC transporter ATP-binding protein [Candidatus Woesearchaeota archaeon]|jgi:ABC-2 type transport system ATP-binding protein|nr:ABC transporter ATP-binding protein [Candidatus Woesearchaeota archaeon]
MIIEIKDLVKNYKKVEALKGLTVSVPEKSVFGLLGPNGSGKTSTLCLLTRILKPESGSISIFGKPVDEYYKISDRVGALLQDTDLFYNRCIYDNLLLFAKLDNVPDPKKRVDELLKLVNLEDKAHESYANLSHGQKKLVQLCQALLKNPDLLILDEPTAGFDPKNIILVTKIIKSLKNKTILITSNHLEIVKKLCTHVAIINDGKVAYEGKVTKKTNLEKLYLKIVK